MKIAFMSGIIDDIKRRAPHYLSDYSYQNVANLKVLASILFMFFTSLGPAITFSNLLQVETKDDIGVVEVMLSSAITGVVFSIIGGQPLVIVGVTGPVSILTISIYGMAKSWGINFLPFYAWAQIWAAIMHIFLAVFNFCDLISWITRFSCEIFGVLIAIIYIYTGMVGIFIKFGTYEQFEPAIFQLVIALGTAYLATFLSNARNWKVFTHRTRDIISDYGATVSLVLWTAIPFFGSAKHVDVDKLDVPDSFGTTSGRDWFVDLTDLPPWAVFAAILPGFITTVLFFFDHNVSSLMAQAPEFKLKKGSAFHWDFFVVGVCIFITGILGIPPTNGLIPQAPLHVKSLITTKRTHDHITNRHHDEVVDVAEQRVSNCMQAGLIGMMCFPPFLDVIRLIPNAALNGLFLYMGYASFHGNQFAERFTLVVMEPHLRHSHHAYFRVPFDVLRKFTLLQAVVVVIIFGITLTPAAMVFPVLIGILIPMRHVMLPKFLLEDHLHLLDPTESDTESVVGGPVDLSCHSDSSSEEDPVEHDSHRNVSYTPVTVDAIGRELSPIGAVEDVEEGDDAEL